MIDLVAVRDPARFTGPPTRLLTPTSGSEIIERTRLDDQYRAATGGVVRVLAPGGYGKSTLVARWAQHDERAVRWIDLEPIDNDPLVFGHSLNQALSDLDPTDLDPTGPNAPQATTQRAFSEGAPTRSSWFLTTSIILRERHRSRSSIHSSSTSLRRRRWSSWGGPITGPRPSPAFDSIQA